MPLRRYLVTSPLGVYHDRRTHAPGSIIETGTEPRANLLEKGHLTELVHLDVSPGPGTGELTVDPDSPIPGTVETMAGQPGEAIQVDAQGLAPIRRAPKPRAARGTRKKVAG